MDKEEREPIEELELPEEKHELRAEPDIDDGETNDPTEPETLEAPEQIQIEFPNGSKINLASRAYDVFQLSDLALQIKNKILGDTKPKRGVEYIG